MVGSLPAELAVAAGAVMRGGPLGRVVGARVEAVITRLLGVRLAALATQYVLDGLKGTFVG